MNAEYRLGFRIGTRFEDLGFGIHLHGELVVVCSVLVVGQEEVAAPHLELHDVAVLQNLVLGFGFRVQGLGLKVEG